MNHTNCIKSINFIAYLCLIIWPAFWLGSFMMFDAPGAGKEIIPWAVVLFTTSQPIQIFIAPKISRKKLEKGENLQAYIVSAIPIAPFAFLFIVYFLQKL